MTSADGEEPLTSAELAARITNADRPSSRLSQRLMPQWKVPLGVTPHIPLWFTVLFLVLVAGIVLNGLMNR